MFKNILLAALALTAPLGATAQKPAFFAMDTAIRSLDNVGVVAELGYDGIAWRPEPPQKLAQLLERLRAQKLNLFALYSGAALTDGKLRWPRQIENDLPILEGSGAVLWLTIGAKDFPPSDPAADSPVVTGLQQLAELAAPYGVRIALYPHRGSWMERFQDAVRLAQKVNHPALGVTFNLCHCLMLGDEPLIPELLQSAGKHLFLVTLNGADSHAAKTHWGRLIRPLDEGDFPLRSFLKTLAASGYSGPIGLQAFGIPLSPEENLRRSIRAWRTLHPENP
ncbi:MAG: Inosose isomerase [Verrucomicrobiota bacterium]|jgi:sugar phosphate isomerase/epimerase